MSLQTRLLLAIGYVLLIAIVAFEVPLAITTANRTESEIRTQASAQIDVLSVAAAEDIAEGRAELDQLTQVAGEAVRGRVVVVNSRGRLLSDSEGERRGTDFTNRPEIVRALAGERLQEDRDSTDLGMGLIVTATPIKRGNDIVGAVRITQSTDAQGRAIRDSIFQLILIGLLVLAIGLAAAVVLARSLAGPVENLTGAARRIAEGDLEQRAPIEGSSEQRTLARSFNEMTDRLAQALDSQRRFVADASHQLRTPLTAIRLRLEEASAAIEDSPGSTAELAAANDEIASAVGELDRLSNIITEMLTLSRAGEANQAIETIGLDDLAAGALERWGAEARHRGIDLEAQISDAPVSSNGRPNIETPTDLQVRCARADADRVLDSLIENAIFYGAPTGTVQLAVHPGLIEVRDDGPGLDGEDPEQLFDRFHRGSRGRAVPGGTGLGLSIARELARSWKGDINLTSRPEGGTTATISFPDRDQLQGSEH